MIFCLRECLLHLLVHLHRFVELLDDLPKFFYVISTFHSFISSLFY